MKRVGILKTLSKSHYLKRIMVTSTRNINMPINEIEPWGLLTSLDLYECDPAIIRSADDIRRYVKELCDLIKMKPFGECHVVHFGKDKRVEGYSMMQLIETSLISGHFANLSNSAYIDIFSCKPYDPQVAADFTKHFFRAKSMNIHITKRL